MPCSGDAEQPCGAGNRLTVYTSDLMAPAVAGWKYSGCYADTVEDRVLTGAFYADPESMTHESCIEFCADNEYRFAGVEYGVECCEYSIETVRSTMQKLTSVTYSLRQPTAAQQGIR